MFISLASIDQIDQIEPLFIQAIASLKKQQVDQWQNGYPNKDSIINDIKNKACYVLSINQQVVATMALIFAHEPTYDVIDGSWLSNQPYATIHRIAISEEFKGKQLASQLFTYAKAECINRNIYSLRVDTHQDNQSMQKAILKNGFTYCGVIYLADGASRLAYEIVLEQ